MLKKISIHTWITIGFPLYLIGFEFMLRNLFKVEISTFIGPSLGASGIGFLLECIKPKKIVLSQAQKDLINSLPPEYIFRDEKDERIVVLAWVYILLCSAVWVYICSISMNNNPMSIRIDKNTLRLAIGLGTLNYLIGIICLFAKEKNLKRNRALINYLEIHSDLPK